MGLDTSHGVWHGAYSAFTRWRHEIAGKAGYAVWDVKMPDGIVYPTIMLDWGHVTEKNLLGEWESVPADPLVMLFAHQDCEGRIHPEHAALIADRLEALLPLLKGDGGGHVGDYRQKTQTVINGLRLAASLNEPVEFH